MNLGYPFKLCSDELYDFVCKFFMMKLNILLLVVSLALLLLVSVMSTLGLPHSLISHWSRLFNSVCDHSSMAQ